MGLTRTATANASRFWNSTERIQITMPFIRCPWEDIKKNHKKETSTTVIFSCVYKFGTEFFYIKCVTMSWCIQYELLYLQNRTTKKFTKRNGNKYLKFSYTNKKKSDHFHNKTMERVVYKIVKFKLKKVIWCSTTCVIFLRKDRP